MTAVATPPQFGPTSSRACHNWIATKYQTLRYRNRIIELVSQPSAATSSAAARAAELADPITGESPLPRESKIASGRAQQRLRRYVQKVVREGEYQFGPRRPAELVATLRDATRPAWRSCWSRCR